MFALIDGNSFYASCEKAFRPELKARPVVVLSNNDGCIVARCSIAKALKVPDLLPYFQVKEMLQRIDAVVFSSNYELYGDMSKRVMDTIESLIGSIEVYSIDECFGWLPSHITDYSGFGATVSQTVLQNTKIPNCVGIAPTKTLAKLANRVAKKSTKLSGVCVLDTPARREWALKRATTRDVWGIGARISERLAAMGIHTAHQLATYDPKALRKQFSVCVERTARELNGESCMPLDAAPEPKQQIICSRSFSHKVFDCEKLQQAVSQHAERACEKLREQDGVTSVLMVFALSSQFSGPIYNAQRIVHLPMPTNDSRVVCKAAAQTVAALYSPGIPFHKAGVVLMDLQARKPEQLHFFDTHQTESTDRLMSTLDAVNRRYGSGTLHLAGRGINPSWRMAREMKSPAYTTQWSDLPVFQC